MSLSKARLFVLLVLMIYSDSMFAQSVEVPNRQKRIAVTIAMSHKLTKIIKDRRVPDVGFVNESQLFVEEAGTDRRIGLLQLWARRESNQPINHIYLHISFSNSALEGYQDDFVRERP